MPGILKAVLLPNQRIDILYLYPVVCLSHVNLQYGVEREDWLDHIGKEIDINCIDDCWDEDIQALEIQLPYWVDYCDDIPHIVVSHRAGINLDAAKSMLSDVTWDRCYPFHTTLKAVILFREYE